MQQQFPFHCIKIANPFFESPTNVYVFPEEPVTLIDTGIGTPEALETLEQGLGQHGLAIEQVHQIVVTHKHPDHFGLARQIYDRSGATVWVHQDDSEDVANFDERHDEVLQTVRDRLESWHTPPEKINQVEVAFNSARKLAHSVPCRQTAQAQKIPLSGGRMDVLHMPGHTMGSMCLRFERYLFTGDHVLPDYTPNIGAGELRHHGMLRHYLHSLSRLLELPLDPTLAMPGHGEPIEDLTGRAEEIIDHHEQRTEQIVRRLSAESPRSPYELAVELFGELADYHVMLGTAEVFAHLELLEQHERVTAEFGRYRLV